MDAPQFTLCTSLLMITPNVGSMQMIRHVFLSSSSQLKLRSWKQYPIYVTVAQFTLSYYSTKYTTWHTNTLSYPKAPSQRLLSSENLFIYLGHRQWDLFQKLFACHPILERLKKGRVIGGGGRVGRVHLKWLAEWDSALHLHTYIPNEIHYFQ